MKPWFSALFTLTLITSGGEGFVQSTLPDCSWQEPALLSSQALSLAPIASFTKFARAAWLRREAVYYKDKWAVVVGGSEGIGLAIAKELASHGAHVIIAGRDRSKLELAAETIKKNRRSADQRVVWVPLDVRVYPQIVRVFTQLVQAYGVPDFLMNSAGLATPGYLATQDVTVIDQMIDVNYRGTVYVTQAMAGFMQQVRRGTIVNVSSVAGYIGVFGNTVYAGTKFAVIGFSESLRQELRPYDIRVSVLCPPNTRTPGLDQENKTKPAEVLALEEKARVFEPEEVARYLVKTLPRNPFMIIPGMDSRLYFWLKGIVPAVIRFFTRRPNLPKDPPSPPAIQGNAAVLFPSGSRASQHILQCRFVEAAA